MAEQRDNSELAVANMALSLVGNGDIASLDQPHSKAARECRKHFATIRDRLQRVYRWNFNTVRGSLANLPDAPAYGFTYAYQMPAGCVRILELDGCTGQDWAREGDAIVTDRSPPLKGKWLTQVTDVAKWDAAFAELMAYELAAAIAYQLTRDRGIPRDVRDRLEDLRRHATPADAKEAQETEEGFESEFIAARRVP